MAGVYIRLSAYDPQLLEVAKTILLDAQMLSPTDAKISYNLGLIELDLAATPSAVLQIQKAVDQKPNYEDARMKLAEVYLQQRQPDKAIEQYQYILSHIAPDNTKAKQELNKLTSPSP